MRKVLLILRYASAVEFILAKLSIFVHPSMLKDSSLRHCFNVSRELTQVIAKLGLEYQY